MQALFALERIEQDAELTSEVGLCVWSSNSIYYYKQPILQGKVIKNDFLDPPVFLLFEVTIWSVGLVFVS